MTNIHPKPGFNRIAFYLSWENSSLSQDRLAGIIFSSAYVLVTMLVAPG